MNTVKILSSCIMCVDFDVCISQFQSSSSLNLNLKNILKEISSRKTSVDVFEKVNEAFSFGFSKKMKGEWYYQTPLYKKHRNGLLK